MRDNIHPVEQDEIMAYLDGELSVERAAHAAAHLQECRECQELASELKRVSEGLTMWEVETMDASLKTDVADALDEREQEGQSDASVGPNSWRQRRWVPWFVGAFAGGAAVLLVFSLFFTTKQSEHATVTMMERAQNSEQTYTRSAVSTPNDRDRLAMSAPPMPGTSSQSAELMQRQQAARVTLNQATIGVPATPSAPMILRTAQLTVVTQDMDKARTAMDTILRRYNGYVGDLTVSAPTDGPRKLTATMRVPVAQLDAALTELKTLGRVESESQSGQDVTAQYVDLEARLTNARNTEQRLTDLLRQRTGKLSDVLEVETEISRVREEIERMEGERRLLSKQVEFATLTATVTEEYKAPARALPDSLGTRFRNAAVEGYQSVINLFIEVGLFLVSEGPMLLLWAAILFFPARYAWRKYRNRSIG